MKSKYFIGLDIGTNSVGWAVTNEEYDILRIKGKTAWGARIFKEAENCKSRRMFRSNRRRLQRRKYRIQLLNEVFAEELNKVDDTFLLRLDNSSFWLDDKDKKIGTKSLLFKSKKEETEFYKLYPTIWHLREKLALGDSKSLSDIRNIYLALHHVIKYRGNFLKEGEIKVGSTITDALKRINSFFKEKEESDEEKEYISLNYDNKISEILRDDSNKATRQKKIKELFGDIGKSFENLVNMFASLVTGGEYSLSKINKGATLKISFVSNFDNIANDVMNEVGEDYELIDCAKEIFDAVTIQELMGNHKYISSAMVEVYKNHKTDLKLLKDLVIYIDKKNNVKTETDRLYYKIFKKHSKTEDKEKLDNYAAFVHVNSEQKRPEISEFNKFIKDTLNPFLNGLTEQEKEKFHVDELMKKVDNNTLLQIIANVSTSRIPHQLHLNELDSILDNASKKYKFIAENKVKIRSIFLYKLKYYYGPLNTNSEYSNVVKNNDEVIRPWNIDKVINDKDTRQKFMDRLTNYCSYIYGEKVMPRASLLYEEYQILDRLNVMRINGNTLNKSDKDEIYKFILGRNKTTIADIKSFLAKTKGINLLEITITNINSDIPFVASSHKAFNKLFDLEKDRKVIENYIKLATVYAEEKLSLKTILSDLDKDKQQVILNLKINGWAPLSKELLNSSEISYTKEDGEILSIIDLMREENKNFQMILNDPEYKIKERIDEYNRETVGDKTIDEQIQEQLEQVPAKSRRSIHQSLLIINDIVKATKAVPKKIFIEVTREDDDKKKGKETDSRYDELKHFIKSLKKEVEDFNVDKQELENELIRFKDKLKSKHIYLYFKQMGLNMYTGEKINIEDIINSNQYDVDHIIPQHLKKDDSLDNLVLTDRKSNQNIKKGYYPLPIQIRQNKKVLDVWNYLYKTKNISEKKYGNLMRETPFTLDEEEEFVNSQLNAINYANIQLRNILKLRYPTSEIVFSKAQYPSHIRKELSLVKVRELNDTHHAVDAYLNVIAANTLTTTFTREYIERTYKNYRVEQLGQNVEEKNKSFNMNNKLDNILWQKNDEKKDLTDLGKKIDKTCLRHDFLMTYKNDFAEGKLFDQTLYANDKQTLIPTHFNSPHEKTNRYGGYSGLTQSYMFAVEFKLNGKSQKYIYRVPTLYAKMIKDETELVKHIVKENNGKQFDKISDIKLIRKIYNNQKIKIGKNTFLIYTNNSGQNKYKYIDQIFLNDKELLNYLSKLYKNLDQINSDKDDQVFDVNRKGDELVISKTKNLYLFYYLKQIIKHIVDQANSKLFPLSEIEKNESVFMSKNLKQQVASIIEIISKFTRQNGVRKTSNITNQDIVIIHESPTGLFVRKEKI